MNGAEEGGLKASKSSPKRQKKKISLQDDFFAHSDEPKLKRKKYKSKHIQEAFNKIKSDDGVLTSNLNMSSSQVSNSVPATTHEDGDDNGGLEDIKAGSCEYDNNNGIAVHNSDDDDDDDVLLEVSSEESDIEQFLRSTSMEIGDKDGYDFSYKKEKKRKYVIHVKSKLAIPQGAPPGSPTEAKFLVNGTKLFDRILELIILHFNSMYQMADSNERLRAEQAVLVWVNGRMEVKPFFKPSTLRIPLPSDVVDYEDPLKFPTTEFQCLLIPTTHTKDFLEVYPEFNNGLLYRVRDDEDELYIGAGNQQNNTRGKDVDEDDDDIEILEVVEGILPESIPQDTPQVFVIGLKGADNKRIECQVSKSTSFKSILDHYIKVKQLQNIDYSKVKMIFDDEQIHLDTLVEETELEEDFEVQIVL
ncbi:uncharacterized protein KQ657_000222 [Scheffersomyces spartinae]|uniref:Rad60/SUMO-like domain-containing protein n=1 Tax=Scheffersomyces spartinae TaxID=45513 RepID=A0A9P7VE83_9ASCO|nr:uncharacterized protein KQ657_000222 [Scheffersomyces spartinae]KAG7196209.1 hypothetical protein KQ657_000222 [Scheffersomyces spartinae]